MTDEDFRELLRREEEKRERHWDPAERWRIIQEMITWIDAQAAAPRNSKRRCLGLQAAKLERLRRKDEG